MNLKFVYYSICFIFIIKARTKFIIQVTSPIQHHWEWNLRSSSLEHGVLLYSFKVSDDQSTEGVGVWGNLTDSSQAERIRLSSKIGIRNSTELYLSSIECGQASMEWLDKDCVHQSFFEQKKTGHFFLHPIPYVDQGRRRIRTVRDLDNNRGSGTTDRSDVARSQCSWSPSPSPWSPFTTSTSMISVSSH